MPFEYLIPELRNEIVSISDSISSYLDPQSARSKLSFHFSMQSGLISNLHILSLDFSYRSPTAEEAKSSESAADSPQRDETGLVRLVEINVATLDEFKAVVEDLMPTDG